MVLEVIFNVWRALWSWYFVIIESLKPPKPIQLDSNQNLSEVWKKWKSAFQIFIQATESTEKPDVVKSSILLHCLGPHAKELYDTFQFPEGEELNYDEIISKFDAHFNPRKNLTFNRYNFLTAKQDEAETFDEFYTRLRKLSEDCEFGALRNSLLKDLVIIGIRDKKLKERFLQENDIDLATVLKNGRACEASRKQTIELNKFSKNEMTYVHQINRPKDHRETEHQSPQPRPKQRK